jgi:hypothetical protein
MEPTGASIIREQENKADASRSLHVWGRAPSRACPERSRRVQAARTGVEQLGSHAVCDSIFIYIYIYIYESQDLTLHTMLSDGVAIVGQTFAVGFERYRLVTARSAKVQPCLHPSNLKSE